MKYPVRVSVVMPCYNVVGYVREAIASIIGQTFQDWELIVVDDGSTDGTVDAIRGFDDGRIRLFILPGNVGNYRARNFGIGKARGKYITMFDADDVSLAERLRVQYDFLEKRRDVGAIGSNYDLMDEQGKTLRTMYRSCTYTHFKTKLLADNYMLQSCIFLRSHLLKKHRIKYDERFTYASDYHFVFLCAKHFSIFNIDRVLVRYRLRNDGITGRKFPEQQKFAAQIRREIISHSFGPSMSVSEVDTVCMVLTGQKPPGTAANVSEIEAVLNKALEINVVKKTFPQYMLYDFLHAAVLVFFHGQKKQASLAT